MNQWKNCLPANPVVMKIIEQWGSGIPRMISACKEAGLPELELKEMGGNFRVNMFRPGEKTTQYTTQATQDTTQATQDTTQVSFTELAIFIKTDSKQSINDAKANRTIRMER